METSECDLVPASENGQDCDDSGVGEYWCHTCEQYVDEPCGIGDGEV